MQDQVTVRKANSSRSPILSLVDREFLKSTANINRRSHEAISYLYAEHDASIESMRASPPGTPEWVKEAVIRKRLNLIRWLDELLLTSQSVEALRSWQMVRGLENPNGATERPSGTIIPPFPQPTPPGAAKPRNGILKRGGQA